MPYSEYCLSNYSWVALVFSPLILLSHRQSLNLIGSPLRVKIFELLICFWIFIIFCVLYLSFVLVSLCQNLRSNSVRVNDNKFQKKTYEQNIDNISNLYIFTEYINRGYLVNKLIVDKRGFRFLSIVAGRLQSGLEKVVNRPQGEN